MQTLGRILKTFPHSDFLAPVRISISTSGTPVYESLTLYSRCERFGRNCGLSCSTIRRRFHYDEIQEGFTTMKYISFTTMKTIYKKLILSVKKRVEVILQAKGGHVNY